MTAPYGAWIIAPEGRGTSADVVTLRDLIKALHAAHRPHKTDWLVHDNDARISDGQIQKKLDDIAQHDGPRLVWIVGDAVEVRSRWHLKTNIKPSIRLKDIWEDLSTAAKSKPAHPIIAVVDVCHAADGLKDLPPNLVAFAACADDETARADDGGGWLTRTLCEALTSLSGTITVHNLQGYVDERRIREGLGGQRPRVHLGDHTSYPLNQRESASPPTAPLSQAGYLNREELEALVDACKHLGLCDLERLTLVREHLDDVRFEMSTGWPSPLLQLKSDLLHLNRLESPPGQMPQLAIWIEQARATAGRAGTKTERLLVRLRNRVQGRKEKLAVRYVASSDCGVWATQLRGVLGTHPDFDFDVGELRPGALADLVFIILGARIDPERAQLAEQILHSAEPPPLLLIQCGDPDWGHLEEAQTIRDLKEAAGNLARATTVPDDSSFAEVVHDYLDTLVAEVAMPRDERRRREDRILALANLGSTIKWADEAFENANKEAQEAFDAEDYDEALRRYRSLYEKLQTQPTGERAVDQHRLARTKLNIACTLANQQDLDAARAELDGLSDEDVSHLRRSDTKALSVLAGALVMVERVDRARRLIEEHDLDGTPRQLLTLLDGGGRAPTGANDAVLSLAINQALLDTRMDHAAEDAVQLMTDGSGTLSILLGLQGAIRALEGSVIWAAVKAEVPLGYRETLVERIIATLDTIAKPEHEPHRGIWEIIQYSWSRLTFWDIPPPVPISLRDRVEVVQLPWLEAGTEVVEHMAAGRREQGLQAAHRVATSYPRREPCQRLLARIALELGSFDDCRPAATCAFDLLPVPRNRALLAEVLIRLGHFDEAWQVASKLQGQIHPEAAHIYAVAAHHCPLADLTIDERVAAWRAYLAVQPEHHAARFAPVHLYERAGRIEEAQHAAIEALEEHDFDVDTLANVARLLMLKGDRREALSVLMERLRKIEVPQAEPIRFSIANRIGRPSGYEPDWEALVASGAAKPILLDEAADLLVKRFKVARAVTTAYNAGRLSAATVVELTGGTLTQLAEDAFLNPNGLSLALAPSVAPFISEDEPEEWLVDGITLNIMAAAGLFPTLKTQLEAGHRLVLFDYVRQRVFDEATILSGRAEPDRAETLRELWDFLNTWSPHDPAMAEDEVLAVREDAVLLAWDEDQSLSPRQLARQVIPWLDDEPETVQRLEGWAASSAHNEIPAAVVLGNGLWNTPGDTLDLLRGLKAAGRRVYWTVRQYEALKHALDGAERALRVSERATQVMEFVGQAEAAGWLSVASPPQVALPPPGEIEFLHQALGNDLAYRAFLKEAPQRRWIGADFLPFAWFSGAMPADILRHTAQWTFDRLSKVKQAHSSITEQLITLGSWAVHINAPQPSIDALLSLGFVEALDIEMLRRLERRGLDEPKVLEVFDRLEGMATSSPHAGAEMARLAVALRYAISMRSLWLSDGSAQSWSAETRLTRFLLSRLEGSLSSLPGPSALLIGLSMVYSMILDHPGRALSAKGDGYVVSLTSPSARLAHVVGEWSLEEKQRTASVMRVLTDMLRPAEEAYRARLPILIDLVAAPLLSEGDAFRIPDVLDSVSIIGTLWKPDPLVTYGCEIESATFTYGDMFALAVEALRHEKPRLYKALIRVGVPIEPVPGLRVDFWSTAEALILRSPPDVVRSLASSFGSWIALSDGHLAGLARKLAEAPDDPDIREAFAYQATRSPWRGVRHSPVQFLRWGQTPLLSSWPSSVADLRKLLSEPISLDEDGVWSGRRVMWLMEQPAASQLAGLWGEVPGNAAGLAAHHLALSTVDPALTFMGCRAILEAPDAHPAGRLALQLLVGRLLAARHDVVTVDGVEIDLRHWLTELLPWLVRSVCQRPLNRDVEPKSETTVGQQDVKMSEVEIELLRICRFVLIQLPDINSTPAKDIPWLLFRLYGWLTHQLEELPPQRRRESISVLRIELGKLPTNSHRWPEAFDPQRFANDPRRYRSLVFLYGLLGMEQLARLTHEEGPVEFTPISQELIDQLVEIAEEPISEEELQASRLDPPTQLDWHAPVAVSELGLHVLVQSDAASWSRLTEETRIRWLMHLSTLDSATATGILCSIIATNAASMTQSERRRSREWLGSELKWTEIHINAWLSLALENPLELDRAEESIYAVEAEAIRSFLFGRLVGIHWRRTPEQWEEIIHLQVQRNQSAERDSVPLIAGIATLLDEPDEALAKRVATILRDLAYREGYRVDERLDWVREKVAKQP